MASLDRGLWASDHPGCPVYPTELVFGLDMSQDVTQAAFERQRAAVLSLIEDVAVSESNCPTGARVAVVGYSSHLKQLIRFQDYGRKRKLTELLRNIALERTDSGRRLGAAMRFVGQNVFKRVRGGAMTRKVAVFFSHGSTQDVSDVVTAVMEYRGLNIVPAIVSLKNDPDVSRALQVGPRSWDPQPRSHVTTRLCPVRSTTRGTPSSPCWGGTPSPTSGR